MKPGTIYTIGYGNRQPEDFFKLLPASGLIIDVRRLPRAWHGAYHARQLKKRLGDRYRSEPAFGNRANTGDVWQPVNPDFAYANIPSMGESVRQGMTYILLCAEQDPQRCHRRLVAEAIARHASGTATIVHLGVDREEEL